MRLKSAFIDAMDGFVNRNSEKSDNAEMNDTEQSLIEQAVKASLEEFAPASEASTQQSTLPSAVVTAEPIEKVAERFAEKEKPAMRFVRDVTFPDGSKIQAGSVFVKIWRLRNEGTLPWPEGSQLIVSGGDLLCATDTKYFVPQAQPGEEVDVKATLIAPTATGKHTAYFRLQTGDGQMNFGQRLWAEIIVEEEDPTWAVISTAAFETAHSVLSEDSSPEGDISNFGMSPNDVSSSVSASFTPPLESDVKESLKETVEVAEVPQEEAVIAPAPSTNASAVIIAADVWSRIWAAELEVLKQMGFVDVLALVPFLQKHIRVPASLSTGEDKSINAEGMQHVVLDLLSSMHV